MSARRPTSGDVFELRLRDGRRVLGVVVAAGLTGPKAAPMRGSNLSYLLDPKRWTVGISDERVEPRDLLLPPIYTNQRAWTQGYVRAVGRVEDVETRALRSHCFWDAGRQRFVDDHQRPVPVRTEPCGYWQLVSTDWVDDQVSDALGIERDPVTASPHAGALPCG